MAEGSEDSYLYMKSHSKANHDFVNGEAVSGKSPSTCVPKKLSADTRTIPASPLHKPHRQKSNTVAGRGGSSNVTKSVDAPTVGPPNHDDCMAFDLYEQDPDMVYGSSDYNLRRQSSDFRFNFEDMIVLPMRLKKPSTAIKFDTPSFTDIDEFDYADQHVYYSQLITTVNSNSAVHEYAVRKGPLWDCAWEILVPKGLHPTYLTEDEFVKLVLSQGNDTTKWMDTNIPILHRRALQKAGAARQKLSNAGISPFELTQEYLESFEWMDKIEQDNFIKTFQKLQLQVSFQKQGISMRIEDIDSIPSEDEEKLIGKSHTKLVDGSCIQQDCSSDVDDSFMVDKLSLEEFEKQFWNDDYKKASPSSKKAPAPFRSTPIPQTYQSPTDPDLHDEAVSLECLKNILCSQGIEPGPSSPLLKSGEGSDYFKINQETKNTHNSNRGSMSQSPFSPLEAAKSYPYKSSYVLPPKNPDSHVLFSLQDPPSLTPLKTTQSESGRLESSSCSSHDPSDGSSSTPGSKSQSRKSEASSVGGAPLTGTLGGGSACQSQQSCKTEGSRASGASDKFTSIGKRIEGSPKALKKKLSSVFGTIGRSGRSGTQ
ncbi:hypothetical protein BCON_0006g00820 [Botryotinia convoluta]|uniref:Uncharacterized protein n=1 Tax=Botryotinia convoluta TaxID=54673 RepID=A0A4Z1IT64_9HELO|nr:hypothetical protein BCON_0006g00820 [Botryotinia convoluta]